MLHVFPTFNTYLTDKKNEDTVYGIAGNGKRKVDHVGSMIKVAVRREVAAG